MRGLGWWSDERTRQGLRTVVASAAWVAAWVCGVAAVWGLCAVVLVVACSGVADVWVGFPRVGFVTAAKLTLAPILVFTVRVVLVLRRQSS